MHERSPLPSSATAPDPGGCPRECDSESDERDHGGEQPRASAHPGSRPAPVPFG